MVRFFMVNINYHKKLINYQKIGTQIISFTTFLYGIDTYFLFVRLSVGVYTVEL